MNEHGNIRFGRKHIVKNEVTGSESYVKGNSSFSPAVSVTYGAWPEIDGVMVDPLLVVHPFSNGSEGDGWMHGNCYNCKKFETCKLLDRMADGSIPFKTARRIGYSRLYIQSNKINVVDLTDCKEIEPKQQ